MGGIGLKVVLVVDPRSISHWAWAAKWNGKIGFGIFSKKIDLLLKKYISIKMIDCCKARASRFKALWVRDRVLLFYLVSNFTSSIFKNSFDWFSKDGERRRLFLQDQIQMAKSACGTWTKKWKTVVFHHNIQSQLAI